MRPAVAGLFAVALAGAVLAGDGLVLVPHGHGAGAPPGHSHGISLYRFPIALLGVPADAAMRLDSEAGPSFRLAAPLAETLVGASLILVGMLVVVALAPTRARAARVLVCAWRLPAQWRSPTPTGPPRLALLSA